MYDGYLNFGGNEVANNARTLGYAHTAKCPMFWFRGDVCDGVWEALGDTDLYTYANITKAPWYDPVNPESARFFGVFIIDVDGEYNSTRSVDVVEGVGDGGVLGPPRKGVRTLRVKAMVAADGLDALEYGMGWLSRVLDPGTCGQHGTACGTTDLAFFAECPPTHAEVKTLSTAWTAAGYNHLTNPSEETPDGTVVLATNLATNPSFEAPGASTVIATNVVPNPSMETTGVDIEVRRNLQALNPHTAAGVFTEANYSGIVNTPEGIEVSPHVNDNILQEISTYPALVGDTFTMSVDIEVKPGIPALTLHLTMQVFPSGQAVAGPSVTINPGETKRLSATGTVVAGGDTARMLVAAENGVIDGTTKFLLRNVLAEKSSLLRPYFDGSTSAAGDFTYLWLGTPDASESVQNGKAVIDFHGSNGFAVSSTEWVKSGARSVRMIPRQGATFGDTAVSTPIPIVAGKTYTAKATLRIKKAFVVPDGGTGRARSIYVEQNGGGWNVTSGSSPNEPGVYEHSVTFTAPADANIRLYNGSPDASDEVWWDDYMLVESAYAGPYFDGSSFKVRRNKSLNPRAVVGGGPHSWGVRWGWTGAQVDDLVGNPDGITTGFRTTATSDGSGTTRGLDRFNNMDNPTSLSSYQVVGGGTTTFSFWSQWSADTATGFSVVVRFQDAAAAYLGEAVEVLTTGPTTAGQWVRNEVTVTPPEGAVGMLYRFVGTGTLSYRLGDTLTVTGMVDDAVGRFFDGDYPRDGLSAAWEGAVNNSVSYLHDEAYTYAWTGTPNGSTSTQSVVGVADLVTTAGQAAVFQTGDAAEGDYAARFRLDTLGPIALPATNVLPTTGTIYTLIGKVRPNNRSQTFTPRIRDAQGTPFLAGMGEWTDFAITIPAGGGSNMQTGLLIAANPTDSHAVGDTVDLDAVVLIAGAYGGDYFDGDTIAADADIDFAWTGAVDASSSTMTGTKVKNRAGTSAAVIRSSAHTSDRAAAARIFVMGQLAAGTSLMHNAGNADLTDLPPGVYTWSADVFTPSTSVPVQLTADAPGQPQTTSIDSVPADGWERLSVTFEVTGPGAVGIDVRPLDIALSGMEWWVDKEIVQAGIGTRYFDGGTVGVSPDETVEGSTGERFSWVGTADDSKTLYETALVTATEDPVKWEQIVLDLRRFMHDTGAVSGPLVTDEYEANGFYGNQVEFVFTSERPYVFKATKQLELPPTLPVVMQDIPYNLVEYPSAELSSGTVVVATNFSTNPSAEVNATAWGWVSDGTAMTSANGTIATTTELAAVGSQSIKALYTAPANGANGWFGTNQEVGLPGITPTTRYSVNLWAVGQVESGTAVLGDLEIHVYWLDAANTTLRTDFLYDGSPAGGAAGQKSILPPAGTTKVIVRALQHVTSWSAGAKLRVYVDALAVTVP